MAIAERFAIILAFIEWYPVTVSTKEIFDYYYVMEKTFPSFEMLKRLVEYKTQDELF